jgi:hypothetical protein
MKLAAAKDESGMSHYLSSTLRAMLSKKECQMLVSTKRAIEPQLRSSVQIRSIRLGDGGPSSEVAWLVQIPVCDACSAD